MIMSAYTSITPGPGPATQNPATSTRHCCTGAQRADAQCAATVVCRFAWTRPFSQALPSTARHLSRPASPGTRSLGKTQHVAAHRRIIGSRGLISRSMPRLAYDNQRLIERLGSALQTTIRPKSSCAVVLEPHLNVPQIKLAVLAKR